MKITLIIPYYLVHPAKRGGERWSILRQDDRQKSMNRRQFLKALGQILVTGTLAGLAGCGGSQGPIKIGTLFPHSGDLGYLGQSLTQACELACEQINESGGPVGRKVELISKDTQTNPQMAVERTKELLKEEVPAIVGAVADQVTIKIARLAANNRVVQISPASTSAEISNLPDKDYLFRTVSSNALQGRAQARMAKELGRGLKRVSVIHVDDSYGREVANAFKESFEAEGGEVSAMVAYHEGKDTYRNEVGQALQGEPEFINLIAYPDEGAKILKEALENRWARYFFFSHTMKSTQVVETVGLDLMEGLKGTAPVIGSGRPERIFKKSYQSKFHTIPQMSYVMNAYDAIFLIALAIQQAGRVEGKAIRDNLRKVSNPPGERIFPGEFTKALQNLKGGGKINYEGASGPVDFDQNGDVNLPFEVWKIEETGFVREKLIRF